MTYSKDFPSAQELVKEFHETYGQPVRVKPTLDVPERELRMNLIAEEFSELVEAYAADDFTEMVDAWGDLIYVIYGAALTHGVDLNKVLEEIQQSNMSKLDEEGNPIVREDGKILKGKNFFPPNIEGVLNAQREGNTED